MFPVSARFLDVISGTHRAVARATLLDDRQVGINPTGGLDLPILDGDVKMTSTQDVKTTLDLTIPGDYWDKVQPYAGEIFVQRGVDFGDGTIELVPLGYFRIDDAAQDDAPYGPVKLTGSDRIAAIQQNRVLFPYQVPNGTSHRTIFERLINGRATPTSSINTAGYAALATIPIPISWTGYDPDRITVDGGQSVDDSTYDFLAKLADAQECVLRIDESGSLIVDLRDRDPDGPPLYVVQPGLTGNMIKASRKATRDGVYNIVSAYGSDPASPTGYQLSYNNDPNSPLRWNGLFGPAPRYYASPLLRSPDAAAQAAASILSRTTGLPETQGLWVTPNPALRPLDMFSSKVTGLAERHLVDEITIPLGGSNAVQIATKTTNSDVAPDSPSTPPPINDPGTVITQAQRDQEKAFEITNTAEYSTLAWWTNYRNVQNIGDGRGLTCGIIGFTSADGDLEDMIRNTYVAAVPTAPLASFLTGLHTCTTTGEGDPGATNAANTNLGAPFIAAFQAAADNDAAFRKAQRDYRQTHYWAPAFAIARADGVGPLGQALYYDTYVNHGPGTPSSGDGSFEDIRSQMTVTAPSGGGSESAWLLQFLTKRSAVLTTWGDNPANGRIHMFTDLVNAGKFALTTPLSWSVYGDSFTIPSEPDPHVEGTPAGSFTSIGQALNIAKGNTGANHMNIGIGYAPGDHGATAVHVDYTQDQIQGGFSEPGYYELTADGMVTYTVPLDGGRTSTKTKFPRVEHRGLNPDGSKQAFSKGTRAYIKCRSCVPKLPPLKPEVVLLQFHDANDDVAMIHVHDGLVRAKIKGTYVATLATGWNRQLLTDMMIEVTAAGTVNFYFGDLTTPAYVDHSWEGGFSGWYGKIGAYAQTWAYAPGDTSETRGTPAQGPTDALADGPVIVKTDPLHFEIWQDGWAAPARATAPVSGGGGTPPNAQSLGVGGVATPTGATVATADRSGTFSITSGGTASSPKVYDGGGHTITGQINIAADYVTVQNWVIRGATNSGIYSIGTGNTLQNNDIGGILSDGDVNGITFFGDGTTIRYNIIGRTVGLLSGPALGSHTDGIQTWNTSSKRSSSNVLIEGNWVTGPTDTSDPAYVHQGVQAEGKDSSDGGGGGSGVSQNWTIRGNTFRTAGNGPLNFLGMGGGIIITANTFSGVADSIVRTGDGTPDPTFYGDNIVTGTYGATGVAITTGSPGGGGGGGVTPPSGDDGTQAAVLLGWGAPIDGDEFSYVGPPDPNKWDPYDGPGHDGNGIRSPSAFSVANGILTCYGDNVNGGTTGGMAFQLEQQYWRIEWRVRCYSINPSGGGNRYHPVLIGWPTSDRWPQDGEDDYYEVDCDTGKFEQYIHIPGNDGSAQEYASRALDLQNWHNIAFERSRAGVTTWIDGVQVSQFLGSYIAMPGTSHPTFQMDNFFGHGMEPAKFEAKFCRIYKSPA